MKRSISALSCSGYRVGGVLGLPPFCFNRLLPFVSDGKDGIPLFRRKRYLFFFRMAFTDSNFWKYLVNSSQSHVGILTEMTVSVVCRLFQT